MTSWVVWEILKECSHCVLTFHQLDKIMTHIRTLVFKYLPGRKHPALSWCLTHQYTLDKYGFYLFIFLPLSCLHLPWSNVSVRAPIISRIREVVWAESLNYSPAPFIWVQYPLPYALSCQLLQPLRGGPSLCWVAGNSRSIVLMAAVFTYSPLHSW